MKKLLWILLLISILLPSCGKKRRRDALEENITAFTAAVSSFSEK